MFLVYMATKAAYFSVAVAAFIFVTMTLLPGLHLLAFQPSGLLRFSIVEPTVSVPLNFPGIHWVAVHEGRSAFPCPHQTDRDYLRHGSSHPRAYRLRRLRPLPPQRHRKDQPPNRFSAAFAISSPMRLRVTGLSSIGSVHTAEGAPGMARAHDRPKRLSSSFLANRLIIGAPSFPLLPSIPARI